MIIPNSILNLSFGEKVQPAFMPLFELLCNSYRDITAPLPIRSDRNITSFSLHRLRRDLNILNPSRLVDDLSLVS